MGLKMIHLVCPNDCGVEIEVPEGSVAGHPCPKVVKKDDWVQLVKGDE